MCDTDILGIDKSTIPALTAQCEYALAIGSSLPSESDRQPYINNSGYEFVWFKWENTSVSISSNGTVTATGTIKITDNSVWSGYCMHVGMFVDNKIVCDVAEYGTIVTDGWSKTVTGTSPTKIKDGKSHSIGLFLYCTHCFPVTKNSPGKDWECYRKFTKSATAPIDQIIPGKPSPKITFGNSTTYASTSTMYRGWLNDSSNNGNTITVSVTNPNNATSVALTLQKYVNKTWSTVKTGSNSTNINYTFTEADRGYAFRVTSQSMSATKDTTDGDSFNFRINPLPTMDGTKITTDVTRTLDSVTLNWNHLSHSYCNDADRKYRIHLQKYDSATGQYVAFKTFEKTNETTATFNLSTYGFNKGDKAKIYVEPGHPIEWSRALYGGKVVTRNSIPYFDAGSIVHSNADDSTSNKFFLNNVNISWPVANDSDGDSLSYNIYYRVTRDNNTWGNWTYLVTTNYNFYDNISCASLVSKGKKIQFGVIASDGLENSDTTNTVTITSYELTRDIEPPAPTNLVITPNQTKDNYETLTKLSWTKAVAANGKDCTSYIVTRYVCSSKSTASPDSTKEYTTTTTSVAVDISDVARGKYIIWKVKSKDQFGLISKTTLDSKWCRRNSAPSAPTDFKITNTKTNVYLNVGLQWTAATDIDNDDLTYTIYCSYNGGSYVQIASNVSNTTYTHDVSSRNPGDTLNYKIKAVDSFGISSPDKYIATQNIVINTKPNKPTFIYPTSFIYDRRPRILLKTAGDTNNDTLTVKVTINNTEYNSIVNTSSFNKSYFNPSDDKIVFIPPTNLNIGRNTIKVKVNDTMQDSDETTITIECVEPTLTQIGDREERYITKATHDKLVTMISNSRVAYGLPVYSPSSVATGTTFITQARFDELYTNLINVTDWINTNYSGLNRTKTKPTISKHMLINKKIHNAMLEIITNL